MQQSPSLAGLYVPLITPFTAAGDVAADALDGLAHAVIDDGAHGLVALGTTAEAATLTSAFAQLITAWRAGAAAEGRALGNRLAALSTALFAEPNPAVIKGVLHAQGRIPSPKVRLPLVPASPSSVRTALDQARMACKLPSAQPARTRPLATAGVAENAAPDGAV